MATLTGQTIGGYEIQEELGRGAMGVVFKARQVSMDRVVAIKFLPQRLAQDAKIVARFQREARAAGQLSHPNVVSVHDVGLIQGLNFIAMEFVDGTSCHKRVREKGPYTEKETLDIAGQIAEALKFAHARGILHRDIKPDNFLIDSTDRVRLADLGLARFISDTQGSKDAELTQDGTTMGTPHYMSPEQCKGTSVDQRSDLYSLGASMYIMATGKTPYEAASAAGIMVKVITEAPRPLREAGPHLSAGFVAVVEKLMTKDPQKRFQNAQELLEVIGQCKTGEYQPVTSKQSKVARLVGSAPAAPSRLNALLYGAGCAVAALILLAVLSRGRGQPETTPAPVKPVVVADDSKSATKTDPTTPVGVPAVKQDPVDASTGETHKEQESGKRLGELLREIGPLQRDPVAAMARIEEFLKLPLPPRAIERARRVLADAQAAKEALAAEWMTTQQSARQQFGDNRRGEAFHELYKFAQAHEGSKEAVEARKELTSLIDVQAREAAKIAESGKLGVAHKMLATSMQKLPDDVAAPLQKELDNVIARQKEQELLAGADNKALLEIRDKADALARDPEQKTGKPYCFADAAQACREGATRLKTIEARKDAMALADVYTCAADAFNRMRGAVNDKRTKMQVGHLGRFKDKTLILHDWTDNGVSFTLPGLPPQNMPWKSITPEDLLDIAKAARIGTAPGPAEAFELGALAFACGAEAVARPKLTEVATADSPLKNTAEAALRMLKPAEGATQKSPPELTGAEAAAKQLYDETIAAKEKNNMAVVQKNVKRLVVEFSQTEFVKARADEMSQLLKPGPMPKDSASQRSADKPPEAEPEKKDDSEAAKAELKKLGFSEVVGNWSQDPKRKSAFSLKGGGSLVATEDKELKVSFQLDEGATIGLYLRHETKAIHDTRMFWKPFLDRQNIKSGPGYGVELDNGDLAVYGPKELGGRGRGPATFLPAVADNWKITPKDWHSVAISVKEGAGMDVTIDTRAFHYNDKLRPEGDVRIIIAGNAKIDSPSAK